MSPILFLNLLAHLGRNGSPMDRLRSDEGDEPETKAERRDDVVLDMTDEPEQQNDEDGNGVEKGSWSRSRTKLARQSTVSSISSVATTIPDEPPSRFPVLTKIKHFIFQTGPYDTSDEVVPHYRWTPIFSGIAVPFAILLEIPGLTDHWYIRTEANQTVQTQPNPPLLDAGLAISMACALIANLALIIRFLEKRPKLMTLIAIFTLSVHDLINAVAVIVFAVQRRFNDGFTYGQPFWMTVASTSVSLVINGTLIYDYVRIPDFDKSGSGLTRKQRSLVIIVMILLCWIAFGGLVYSVLIHLSFIDGLYFAVVSIETVGFGDIHPTNPGSQIFAIFYNTIGILNLGMAISTCRETIIESFEHSYRKRSKSIAEKRHENKVARAERRAHRIAIEKQLKEAGVPIYVMEQKASRHGGGRGGGGYKKRMKMVLNDKALTEEQKQKAADEAEEIRLKELNASAEGAAHDVTHHELEHEHLDPASKNARTLQMARELQEELASVGMAGRAQEQSYMRFKLDIQKEQQKEFFVKLGVAWSLFITFWLIGGLIFKETEKWGYGTSLYFCFITFSTIGYGDFYPQTPAGRSIFIVWALLGVGTMTILISILSEAYSSKYHSAMGNTRFESAVKKFRQRDQLPRLDSMRSSSAINASTPTLKHYEPKDPKDALEHIPHQVLNSVRTFHDHVHYFINGAHLLEPPPPSLNKLMDEIAETDVMDERTKKEILADEDARKTLFMVSYEITMRKIIETVEHATLAATADDDQTHASTRSGSSTPQPQPESPEDRPRAPRVNFSDSPLSRQIVDSVPRTL
ncbi:voltage-gated potassium channel [Sistotremastrum niveocremeum HHB9708]|uniref:Voltage-gated potassium channel n=1 Tax=Sistotremastrum niveocremeum HHB9708 TaxID=1314777 RepID=A0A164YY66_9AGAM|nr:voltage-gated potassium channel [Sistotremastrum niveocremeum HHB9708]